MTSYCVDMKLLDGFQSGVDWVKWPYYSFAHSCDHNSKLLGPRGNWAANQLSQNVPRKSDSQASLTNWNHSVRLAHFYRHIPIFTTITITCHVALILEDWSYDNFEIFNSHRFCFVSNVIAKCSRYISPRLILFSGPWCPLHIMSKQYPCLILRFEGI